LKLTGLACSSPKPFTKVISYVRKGI